MTTPYSDRLEVLTRRPSDKQPCRHTPLLFVHGAYVAAWCWEAHFLPFFAQQGWQCHAVSLSGHGASPDRDHMDSYSLDQYVSDVASVVEKLPVPPVLIGHSMGGMVVQKYLEKAEVPAAALLCSVPPQGLISSALGLLLNTPHLLTDMNRMLGGGLFDADSFRNTLFHQAIDDADLQRYHQLCQPESHRALWDMTLFNLPQPQDMHRPPMLVMGAEYDKIIPAAQVEMTAATYGLEAKILPGMGHGIMLEKDWLIAAGYLEHWLRNTVD